MKSLNDRSLLLVHAIWKGDISRGPLQENIERQISKYTHHLKQNNKRNRKTTFAPFPNSTLSLPWRKSKKEARYIRMPGDGEERKG